MSEHEMRWDGYKVMTPERSWNVCWFLAVSYTHLTLPTN